MVDPGGKSFQDGVRGFLVSSAVEGHKWSDPRRSTGCGRKLERCWSCFLVFCCEWVLGFGSVAKKRMALSRRDAASSPVRLLEELPEKRRVRPSRHVAAQFLVWEVVLCRIDWVAVRERVVGR